MEDKTKSATQGRREKIAAFIDRRRLAVGAVLMMMGAVFIDPALLDNVEVAMVVPTDEHGQEIDEFEQIEMMLANAESGRTPESAQPADTYSANTATANTTNEMIIPTPPQQHASPTLMIPELSSSAPTQQVATQTVSTYEHPVPEQQPHAQMPVQSVSYPTNTLEIPVQEPPTVSPRDTPPAAAQLKPASSIRLMGTIDPIL